MNWLTSISYRAILFIIKLHNISNLILKNSQVARYLLIYFKKFEPFKAALCDEKVLQMLCPIVGAKENEIGIKYPRNF